MEQGLSFDVRWLNWLYRLTDGLQMLFRQRERSSDNVIYIYILSFVIIKYKLNMVEKALSDLSFNEQPQEITPQLVAILLNKLKSVERKVDSIKNDHEEQVKKLVAQIEDLKLGKEEEPHSGMRHHAYFRNTIDPRLAMLKFGNALTEAILSGNVKGSS